MRGTLRQPSGHQLATRCKQNLFICRFTRLARARCGVTRKTRHTGPRVTATQSLLSNGTSLCVSPAPGSRAFEGALSQHRTGSHLTLTQAGGGSDLQLHRSRSLSAHFAGFTPLCASFAIMSKSIANKNLDNTIDKTSLFQDTLIVGVCDREGH